MSEYFAKIQWRRTENENYIDNKYSRGHTWSFDGGATIQASASPHIVPIPLSVEANVDPEEAFVASLSSCHMLFFLSIAATKKYIVDSYTDDAIGVMEKDADGKMAMTKVTLRPKIIFFGENQPNKSQLEKMHHASHQQCFIANSVKTTIDIEINESEK